MLMIQKLQKLSTHDLTRRSTLRPSKSNRPTAFQLTTSQGGRRNRRIHTCETIAFQLTTSQGGRHRNSRKKCCFLCFQLTTSQGGRHGYGCIPVQPGTFNSRPHKEVDQSILIHQFIYMVLSTHDLTRRSTQKHKQIYSIYGLSTHDLTRRSTYFHISCF